MTGEREEFAPRAILDLELSDRSVQWKGDESTLQRERALVLVRLHSRPLGVIDVALGGNGDLGDILYREASEKLASLIAEHDSEDHAHMPARGDQDERDSDASCLGDRMKLLNDAPSVSVVLATKNRPVLARRCLESIYQLEYTNYEVVVVDSSTGDETENLIRENFPNVRYVRNFAGRVCVAKTRGAKEASGKYIAFTDDDAEVDRHWISQLALSLEAVPSAACATGLVLPLELETQAQLWFEESGAFVEGIRPRRIGLAHREPGSLLPYATGRIGAGVNMAWRRDTLTELGYFDIALDTCGAEDLAVFFDALCAGYEIVYEPGAIVWHQHRRTVEELRAQTLWHATGLGAYLTRCVVKEPGRVLDLLTRIPGGLRYGFAAKSVRNEKKSRSFPPEVTRQEWIGFVKGPAAYIKGSLAVRRSESPTAV
ncbi:MAG TPA: glycosyltransferase [Acidimicrobiales bacterium]|nr:glycosyltransferase [Acidimicrobiales bacterium]